MFVVPHNHEDQAVAQTATDFINYIWDRINEGQGPCPDCDSTALGFSDDGNAVECHVCDYRFLRQKIV